MAPCLHAEAHRSAPLAAGHGPKQPLSTGNFWFIILDATVTSCLVRETKWGRGFRTRRFFSTKHQASCCKDRKQVSHSSTLTPSPVFPPILVNSLEQHQFSAFSALFFIAFLPFKSTSDKILATSQPADGSGGRQQRVFGGPGGPCQATATLQCVGSQARMNSHGRPIHELVDSKCW